MPFFDSPAQWLQRYQRETVSKLWVGSAFVTSYGVDRIRETCPSATLHLLTGGMNGFNSPEHLRDILNDHSNIENKLWWATHSRFHAKIYAVQLANTEETVKVLVGSANCTDSGNIERNAEVEISAAEWEAEWKWLLAESSAKKLTDEVIRAYEVDRQRLKNVEIRGTIRDLFWGKRPIRIYAFEVVKDDELFYEDGTPRPAIKIKEGPGDPSTQEKDIESGNHEPQAGQLWFTYRRGQLYENPFAIVNGVEPLGRAEAFEILQGEFNSRKECNRWLRTMAADGIFEVTYSWKIADIKRILNNCTRKSIAEAGEKINRLLDTKFKDGDIGYEKYPVLNELIDEGAFLNIVSPLFK